ncbi:MAG: hypothetical protein JNL90_00915 [Planctomycetes bacterium]|nr:hypothetical protein [Planctomycetota bacterium]
MTGRGRFALPLVLGVVAAGGALGVTAVRLSCERSQLDPALAARYAAQRQRTGAKGDDSGGAADGAAALDGAGDAECDAALRALLEPQGETTSRKVAMEEDEEGDAASPRDRPGTEQSFRRLARERLADGFEPFAEEARARLVAAAPLAEKVAWLLEARAADPSLYDELCDSALAGGVTVDARLREAIVGRLNAEVTAARAAAQDDATQRTAALRSIDCVVFEPSLPLHLRLGAARTLFAQLDAPLLEELVARVATLTDAALQREILAALDGSTAAAAPAARERLLRVHGWSAPPDRE